MPRVVYTDRFGVFRETPIAARLSIGRHPSQDIQLVDTVVSKAHATIDVRTDGTWVEDSGSRNGTFLNGRQISTPEKLSNGDQIQIGSTVLTFQADKVPTMPTATRVKIVDSGLESAISHRVSGAAQQRFEAASRIHDVEQLRIDYEKLRISNELNQAVSLEFDPIQLLNKILETAFQLFPADRGVILLQDSGDESFRVAASRVRRGGALGGDDIAISSTIIQEITQEKVAVLSQDAQIDERFQKSKSIILSGVRATLSVPLLYKDRLLGIIHLDSSMRAGAFTDKDLSLVTGFANQAAMAIEHARLVDRSKNEALAREQLGRLLPQEIVDDIMAGRKEITRAVDERPVSVLFADIRDFTGMSERQPATNIVAMLNECFEVMVECVFRHGGTLDKFVGDQIMAVWGAPLAAPDHAFNAVAAAIDMKQAIADLNRRRRELGREAIGVGIGINTGEVVAGYMGSTRAMSYTVIGDIVNTAARLCSIAAPDEILVSGAITQACGMRIESVRLDAQAIKGKRNAVDLYRVVGIRA
jgi:adenylate cyclase